MMAGISRYIILLIVGGVAFSSAGCLMKKHRMNTLPTRVEAYNYAFRWKDYTSASAYVADTEDFLKKVEELGDNYEVLDYEIVRTSLSADGASAEVEVVRSYHIFPSVAMQRQRIVQQWKYNPQRKNWFLISPY